VLPWAPPASPQDPRSLPPTTSPDLQPCRSGPQGQRGASRARFVGHRSPRRAGPRFGRPGPGTAACPFPGAVGRNNRFLLRFNKNSQRWDGEPGLVWSFFRGKTLRSPSPPHVFPPGEGSGGLSPVFAIPGLCPMLPGRSPR